MTAQYADFIAAFPEFSNTTTYPQATITFWLGQAYSQLNATRFGAQIDLAAMLFTAHNVVLGAREAAVAATGAPVGQASGPLSAKGVGPVSASYDTASQAIEGAGAWNATTYGQRLYTMMRAYNAGPAYARARRRHFILPRLFLVAALAVVAVPSLSGCASQQQTSARQVSPADSFLLGALIEACFENSPENVTHVDCLQNVVKDPAPYLDTAREMRWIRPHPVQAERLYECRRRLHGTLR